MGNTNSCQKEPVKKKETIFKNEVYRIPALFYNRDENILMAFAEKRTNENDSSTEALVMKTGKVKKEEMEVTIKWSEQKTLIEKGSHRPMNPCPLYEKNNKTLFLFFIRVEGECTEQWQIDHNQNKARLCYVKTTDNGQSWSDETDLTHSLVEIKHWATFAVGPGHGLQTESGRLIVPVYAYVSGKSSAPHAVSLYSDDKGETWKFGKMLKNESLECQMAEYFDHSGNSLIYCNARTKGSYREEDISHNKGEDFSKLSCFFCFYKNLVETTGGCQGSVVSFPDQDGNIGGESSQNQNKWLLFTHPSDKSKRSKLGVYVNKSPKDPSAWSAPWVINCGFSGYSDLAYIDEGWFACLMECGEKKYNEQIAFQMFSYNEVKQAIKK
ncbi:sialidase-3-like [Notothenia coriiceps]|uniref:exo-alpha-sialidase n=1 Tax=Notothenia coriiceps TaxID=8208 RepID=A0A6I9NLF3_9TELE|nr:PREDICTED: sialidase-3-like [Notothenia coriiceps]